MFEGKATSKRWKWHFQAAKGRNPLHQSSAEEDRARREYFHHPPPSKADLYATDEAESSGKLDAF